MPDDEPLNWDLIFEALDVLEGRADNQHTGQVIGLIHDVARIHEGALDTPSTPTSWCRHPTAPQQPCPPGRVAVIVSAAEVKTLLAALGDAAEYMRDRAETCAGGADQSCATCQWHLQAAGAAALQRAPATWRTRRPAAGGRRQGGRKVTEYRTAPAPCTVGQTRRVAA